MYGPPVKSKEPAGSLETSLKCGYPKGHETAISKCLLRNRAEYSETCKSLDIESFLYLWSCSYPGKV